MHFDLKRKTALVAATAALAIAGCGGDDDDGGGGGEPLSAEDYATEIESVLTTFGEESISLGTELSSAHDAGRAPLGRRRSSGADPDGGRRPERHHAA